MQVSINRNKAQQLVPLANLAVPDGLWFLEDTEKKTGINQKVAEIRIICISEILPFPLVAALAHYTLRMFFHLIYFE